jgi:hypothetical protein
MVSRLSLKELSLIKVTLSGIYTLAIPLDRNALGAITVTGLPSMDEGITIWRFLIFPVCPVITTWSLSNL